MIKLPHIGCAETLERREFQKSFRDEEVLDEALLEGNDLRMTEGQ